MAKKLNKKLSFGTVFNSEIVDAVFYQDGYYFDYKGNQVGAVERPPEVNPISRAKDIEAREESLARATAILGDLGRPSIVDAQAQAQRENIAAERAEVNADEV